MTDTNGVTKENLEGYRLPFFARLPFVFENEINKFHLSRKARISSRGSAAHRPSQRLYRSQRVFDGRAVRVLRHAAEPRNEPMILILWISLRGSAAQRPSQRLCRSQRVFGGRAVRVLRHAAEPRDEPMITQVRTYSATLCLCHPDERSEEGSPPLETVLRGGDPSSLCSSG